MLTIDDTPAVEKTANPQVPHRRSPESVACFQRKTKKINDYLEPLLTHPKVSVFCTFRNAGATIEEVITSVLNQTFRDLELILVDDSSTDRSTDIAKAFAKKDTRVRILTPPSPGRGSALNFALKHAKADFLANIDADDPSHPQRLEIQLRLLELYPNFAVLGTCTEILYGDQTYQPTPLSGEHGIEDVTTHLAYNNPITHSSVMFNRVKCEELGTDFYDENRPNNFDYDFWARIAENGGRLGRTPLILSSKRIHSAQSFENRKRFTYMRESLRIQLRCIRAVENGHWAIPYLIARLVAIIVPKPIRMLIPRKY